MVDDPLIQQQQEQPPSLAITGCCSAVAGDTETVKQLLANGADVNVTTEIPHFTPLHIACRKGHTATVKVLLDHGADVEAEYSGDHTSAPRHFLWSV